MPKTPIDWKSYDQNRRYQDHWTEQFPWVEKAADESENAFCKLCQKVLRPRVSYLQNHELSKQHKTAKGQANFAEKKKLMEAEKLVRLRSLQAADLGARNKAVAQAAAEGASAEGDDGEEEQQQQEGGEEETISYTITPLAAGADPNTVQVQQVQTDPNTMQQVQVVQALPAGAQVVQQVQQGQFAPVEPPKPKKYYPDPVSAHILDQTSGCPAEAIAITLWKMTKECKWSLLSTKHTNSDGRTSAFLRWEEFQTGAYKMHFNTGDYFKRRGLESFYPYTEIVFEVKNADEHFHIPLLISPFGYSTYRGS